MRALLFISTLLSFFWKRKLAVTIAMLLLALWQVIIYFKFINRPSLIPRRITSRNSMNMSSKTAPQNINAATGSLNLHFWFETCAKDLNTLCNFPMFAKAPDLRVSLHKTIIDANDNYDEKKDAEGLRMFGFIIPSESGVYLFTVKFCSAEIWLSQDESWANARRIYNDENLSREKKDSRISEEVDLTAGKKHYMEVVSACFLKANKLQVLWKTPTNSDFQIINGSFLSHYHNDSNVKDLKIYDELIPDSPACATRRHQKTYFDIHEEISYLSHDEIKYMLPYYEYKPSYTVNHPVGRYHAVTYHVVHTFIYPFPVHQNLRDQKNWIYPLDEEEAFLVADAFIESLEKAKPRKFGLKKIRSVERKTDEKKGNRYLIEAELWDLTNNKSVLLSEYVFMPNGTNKLYYPTNLQWNTTAPVYLVVTAKNLGRWLHHFIKNVETIFKETNDPNLHVIIFDYNSSDIDLEKVLKQSSLKNYMLLRQSGEYSRTRSFTEAINLVSNPQSIIFMVDLHLHISSPLINNIRKHCIEGRMVYTPIIVQLECGANPTNLAGVWQVYGYGIIGMYKSDWIRAGGFPMHKKTWGGEDWALVDALFGLGIEFERMRSTHLYHYHHSKRGLW